VSDWYRTLGTVLDGHAGGPLPAPSAARSGQSFLDVVLPGVAGCGDRTRAEQAEKLLWSAQYLGDVSRMRADLVGPARQIAAARSHPAWAR
jgi:hypothetical protein